MRLKLVLCACILGIVGTTAQQPRFDGRHLWRHVEVLAADDMEGRGIGTAGIERAEAYVVENLKKAGLAPAGVNGYFQPVGLAKREVVECSAALVRSGRADPLARGEEAVCTTDVDIAANVDAPLVFLGYGLQVPEKGHDDFAGLDLKGKIAVTIPGLPEGVDGPLAADATAKRWDFFRKAGLVGWIFMPGPNAQWASLAANAVEPKLHLTGKLDETHDEQIMMYFNPAHAAKLFDGTGHSAAELFALGRARKSLPPFELPVRLRAAARVVNTPVESSNVVAKLEGDDSRLRNEYVVVSAHIDHLGIGRPVNGDQIYNGALDNASGVAALLDIADSLERDGPRPKRSVLFTFFTGEEDGHLGSKYFTAHPTVDRKSIVADINVDGIQAIVPLTSILVLGEHESSLGEAARRVATAQNLVMDVDIEPQTNRLTCCSDQGSFVTAGIPAIKLNVGFPGELNAVQEKWRREVHHTPSDDTRQPVNFDTFAKYEEVLRALVLEVANGPRPEWKSDSFYQRYAK